MFRHLLLLFFSALALSQAGNLIRLCEAPALTIALFRLTLAFFILLPFSASRIRQDWKNISHKTWLTIGLMSIVFSTHFFTWINSVQLTRVANAAICFSLHPVFTTFGAWIFLGERLNVRVWIALILGLAGVVVVSIGDISLSSEYFQGDLWAVGAGMLFSIHCLLGRTLRKGISNFVIMQGVYAGGIVLALILVLVTGSSVSGFSARTWVGFLSLAIFPTILGHASLIYLMKYFKASSISTFLLIEPVLAGVVAYVAFQEQLTLSSWIGYALIVGGLVALFKKPPSDRGEQC